jgi:hypothetical protein
MLKPICVLDWPQVFDFSTAIFDRARPQVGCLTMGVESASAVAFRRRVFVVGGCDQRNEDVTAVQCYDVDTSTCTIITHMPCAARLASAMLYRNYIIVLGKLRAFVLNLEQVSLQHLDSVSVSFDDKCWTAFICNAM